MEMLVLAIQLLSLALLVFGAGLCLWFRHHEEEEAEAQRKAPVQRETAGAEPASVTDLHHGTAA